MHFCFSQLRHLYPVLMTHRSIVLDVVMMKLIMPLMVEKEPFILAGGVPFWQKLKSMRRPSIQL